MANRPFSRNRSLILIAWQENLETMPTDALAVLEDDLKSVKEELEASRKTLKALTHGKLTERTKVE